MLTARGITLAVGASVVAIAFGFLFAKGADTVTGSGEAHSQQAAPDADPSKSTPGGGAVTPGNDRGRTGAAGGGRQAVDSGARDSRRAALARNDLPPVAARAVTSIAARRDLLSPVPSDLKQLTDEELSALRHVVFACMADLREIVQVVPTARMRPERRSAIDRLEDACRRDLMPRDLNPLLSRIATEELRRQRPSNVYAAIATDALARPHDPQADRLASILHERDPFAIWHALGALTFNVGSFEQRSASDDRQLQLMDAWQVALCRMAGGCGADAYPTLSLCAQEGHCSGAHYEAALRAARGEAWPEIAALADRLQASYLSND